MNRLKKFLFVSTVCLIVSPAANQVCATENQSKPNILVILVDDLGYGDLSTNGGKDIRTPNIDRLFEKGMRFSNFYANCTVCSPPVPACSQAAIRIW